MIKPTKLLKNFPVAKVVGHGALIIGFCMDMTDIFLLLLYLANLEPCRMGERVWGLQRIQSKQASDSSYFPCCL